GAELLWRPRSARSRASLSTKAYRSGQRGRPTAATSRTVRTAVGSSTFGCSRSAAEILFRSPRGRATIGSRTGQTHLSTLDLSDRFYVVGLDAAPPQKVKADFVWDGQIEVHSAGWKARPGMRASGAGQLALFP